MDDQRRGMRRSIFYYLSVKRGGEEEELGKLGDISCKGALILTDNPKVLEGRRVSARISLPQSFAGSDTELRVSLQGRWAKRDKNPRYSMVGCSMEFEEDQSEIIEQLIELYGFSNGYRDLRKERQE
jgi:hypothetical protein